MSRRPSKRKRWEAEHGSKVAHPSRGGAEAHAADLSRRSPNGEPWQAYPCRWGESHDAPAWPEPHFHVGRKGQWGRKMAKP